MTITLDTTSLYSGKGFDVQSMVNQILNAQRTQEDQWKSQQTLVQNQTSALTAIQSEIGTFYTASTNLTDFNGVLGAKIASSSDTGALVATADSYATTGKHVLAVEQLATTGSAYSTAIASGDSLDSGCFDLTVGSTTKTVTLGDDNSTLSDVADAINKLGMGVTAAVQTDAAGSRLTIVSNTSGSAGALSISGGTSQLSFNVTKGQNAIVDVDGVPYESASNTVDGAISGVTLNLATANPDKQVTLSVSQDATQVAQAIGDWVDSYNALVKSVNTQFSYNSTTNRAGALSGDSSLRLLQDSLLHLAPFSMDGNGDYGTLRSIGIDMEDDGTLSVDSTTLNDALANHFSNLTSFFQGENSFGTTLSSAAQMLESPTVGPISLDLQTLRQTNQDLTNEISDFETRLASQQQTLLLQYSQINAALQELPSLQNQISQMLDSTSISSTSK
ncbi:flagellar hook-associated 2-like protein [Candidatus Koribacter versatilis Ellin345]|uniref:Flagellar hook-associated protein 2 n=1 Tax=Koribacter versatilis (strain Ellin345) TaxID=204669 RepID=Q1IMG3_KORVE|nr:flagellar filament capping protein FliD [Candidatus Koribacter versatilis]ABF41937.1 flagellar hook-associated 2-like protein [Candidatus Koribacter versatilis Ellin345]